MSMAAETLACAPGVNEEPRAKWRRKLEGDGSPWLVPIEMILGTGFLISLFPSCFLRFASDLPYGRNCTSVEVLTSSENSWNFHDLLA